MSSEALNESLEEQQTEGMDLTMNNHTESKIDLTTESVEEKNTAKSPVVALPIKKKRKKSKKIKRSAEYPKFYRNAYVRYCDEMRPKVCEENAELDSVEITKLVAKKWYSLGKEEKQPYLDEANADKERFETELKAYKTLNPDEVTEEKQPSKKQKISNKKEAKDKEVKSKEVPVNNHVNHEIPERPKPSTSSASVPIPSTSYSMPSSSNFSHVPAGPSKNQNNTKIDDDILKVLIGQNCEVPIFTDTFLEHNKVIESELKVLRKNNIEIEQQNSVLMKHIENMQNGVSKVELEIAENRKRNMQLEVYLTKLRVIMSANFNSLQIPGWKGGATVENVDKYITDLAKVTSNSTLNKARDIIKKIDLQI